MTSSAVSQAAAKAALDEAARRRRAVSLSIRHDMPCTDVDGSDARPSAADGVPLAAAAAAAEPAAAPRRRERREGGPR